MPDSTQELKSLQAQVNALTSEVGRLRDLEAIQRTIYDYCHYHDRGMSDAVANLFTEDATLEITGYGERLDTELRGREAIRAMYTRLDASWGGPPPSKHVVTNSRIELDGDEAIVVTYLAYGGERNEKGPGGSLYHERLRKEADGRWRFAHKRIVETTNVTVDAAVSAKI